MRNRRTIVETEKVFASQRRTFRLSVHTTNKENKMYQENENQTVPSWEYNAIRFGEILTDPACTTKEREWALKEIAQMGRLIDRVSRAQENLLISAPQKIQETT